MSNWSKYFAERACHGYVSSAGGVSLPRRLFNPRGSPGFDITHDYQITFFDSGKEIDIVVENRGNADVSQLADKLNEIGMSVPVESRPFIARVSYSVESSSRLVITVEPRLNRNGERKNNKEKMFEAVQEAHFRRFFLLSILLVNHLKIFPFSWLHHNKSNSSAGISISFA